MRILVHTIFYRPELTGVAKYTAEMCEWLARRGHDVVVIAPPPYYPHWKVQAPYKQWSYQTELLESVTVRRTPIWLPEKPAGSGRVLYNLSFAVSSFPVLCAEIRHQPDVVLVIEPSLLNAPCAWLLARISGSLAWLHIQDFEIDLAFGLGQLRRGRTFIHRLESWLLKRFDVVSSISERMVRRAVAKGVAQHCAVLFANWFDASVSPDSGNNRMRQAIGIRDEETVALYAGSLGTKQGVELVIQAAAMLPRVKFVICGDGPALPALQEGAKSVPNCMFLPLRPASELSVLLNMADIHLLPQLAGTNDSVLPSKITGMLASGRPVVAMTSPGSDVDNLIDGCGVSVPCGDVHAFAQAISHLQADLPFRAECGTCARKRALEHFQKVEILTKLETELLLRTGASSLKPAAVPNEHRHPA